MARFDIGRCDINVIKSMVSRVKSIAVVHDLLANTQNNQIVNARDLLVLGVYR